MGNGASVNAGPVSWTEPVDLFDGRLWLLGGHIPASGRVSWLPRDARGWQSLNCYVLVEDEHAVMVDSGVGIQSEVVIEQLREVIGDRPLGVYFTRLEADCLSNFGRIAKSFNLTHTYAVGLSTPFDFFDDIATQTEAGPEATFRIERRQGGDTLEVGDVPRLTVIRPLLRLLATSWAYDVASGTLFTSDSFAHVVSETEDGPRVVDAGNDPSTREDVARYLFPKFEWLLRAEEPWRIARDVGRIFAEHDVRTIAPTHGAVIQGEELVAKHKEWLMNAIETQDAAAVGGGA
jgi:flavorubredoxin